MRLSPATRPGRAGTATGSHRARWPAATGTARCQALGLARSSFYYQPLRRISA